MPLNNGTDLVLYFHPYSFYSQKVIMAMHQKGIKFRPVCVDIQRGKQFSDKFLNLNPKGEVPVLVDGVIVLPDSEHIMNYLEDNFTNGSPSLRPSNPDLRKRCDELHKSIHELNIEALTLGCVIHDDLELNPKSPYNNVATRSQIKSFVENRAAILQTKIVQHPQYAENLTKKLEIIKQDTALCQNRDKYEDLILSFEKVMDECEAELQSHEDPSYWLCSSNISVADIGLSILLYRLWLLGFERKMWEKNRPFVKRYFARVKQIDSFRQATTMFEQSSGLKEVVTSPIFWGFLGAVAIAGGGYYLWNKTQGNPMSLLGFLSSGETDSPKKGSVGSSFGQTSSLR